MERRIPAEAEAVVVGAGMAGLAAAAQLLEAGVDVFLLEGQARIGGRVETEYAGDGQVVERGAQGINGDMTAVLSLVRHGGLQLAPIPGAGRAVFDGIGAKTASAALEALDDLFEEAINGDRRLQALRRDPQKSVADALTRSPMGGPARRLAASKIEELWGRPIDSLQFAHAVDVFEGFASERGDWEFQIAEGFGRVASALAAPLGERLILKAPVTSVEATRDGVTLHSEIGSLQARMAVIAVPPTVASRLLPQGHWAQRALSAYRAGDLIKYRLRYRRAFWRDAGLSGTGLSLRLSGLATSDTTLEAAVLTLFVGGDSARGLSHLTAEARWRKIQAPLVRLFGAEAAAPDERSERIWVDDPWSGGAYNAHVVPGPMLAPDAVLRRLRKRVTFASAEIATRFPGYVEGALHEGRRAADRVKTAFLHKTR